MNWQSTVVGLFFFALAIVWGVNVIQINKITLRRRQSRALRGLPMEDSDRAEVKRRVRNMVIGLLIFVIAIILIFFVPAFVGRL